MTKLFNPIAIQRSKHNDITVPDRPTSGIIRSTLEAHSSYKNMQNDGLNLTVESQLAIKTILGFFGGKILSHLSNNEKCE